ncbi:hypothetical protein [Achromobacter sp. E1]|uniref:hypothetical protein n=1 Tax=Achromobacter sp. E1 TaxID=3141581 RepID=UPI0030CBF17B
MTKKLWLGDRYLGDYEPQHAVGTPGYYEGAIRRFEELGHQFPPPPSVVEQIISLALGFAQTAQMNHERMLKGDLGPDGVWRKDRTPIAPFVVNASLALELYLKALAEANGTRISKVHDLDKLYNALPEAAREKLDRRVSERAPEVDLPPMFLMMRRAFVEWRYTYERSNTDGFPSGVAVMLLDVLHTLCVEEVMAVVKQPPV